MGKRGASNAPKAKPKPKAKQTPKAKPSPKAAKASARKRKAEPTSPTIAFKPVTRSDFDNLFGRSAAAQALSNTHGPAGSGVQRIEHMPPSVPNSPATIPEAVQPAAPGTNEGPAAEHQEPSPTNAADEAHETVLETQEAVEGVAVERREAAPAATLADSDAIDQSAMPLPSGKEPESHESHEEVEQMASAVSSPETLRKMRVSKKRKTHQGSARWQGVFGRIDHQLFQSSSKWSSCSLERRTFPLHVPISGGTRMDYSP